MDFIDDDNDEENTPDDLYLNNLCQEAFKFILQKRPSQKVEDAKIFVLIISDTDKPEVSDMIHKLDLLKFSVVTLTGSDDLLAHFSECNSSDNTNPLDLKYDVVFDVNMGIQCIVDGCNVEPSNRAHNKSILQSSFLLTVPGGHFITACLDHTLRLDADGHTLPFSDHQWVSDNRLHCTDKLSLPAPHLHVSFVWVRRRAICCNTSAARYWGGGGCETAGSEAPVTGVLSMERQLLEEITVCRPAWVYNGAATVVLPDYCRAKAANALKKHGVCIVRRLFDPQVVLDWGRVAEQDLALASVELKASRGIDLDNPVEGQVYLSSALTVASPPNMSYVRQIINNFHELSMREARRVDLRNGSNTKTKINMVEAGVVAGRDSKHRTDEVASAPDVTWAEHDLRRNEDVEAILQEVMNPVGPHAKGNWGRWNFNGPGPLTGAPVPIKRGMPGAVLSLGGCMDQTIHADTPHIFTHVQLPAHYCDLFMPAVQSFQRPRASDVGRVVGTGSPAEDYVSCGCCDLRVGQTAFIAGSHELSVSERTMTTGEEGERELMLRLLRPHMTAGDALLFDCRVLHFGLANRSPIAGRADGDDVSITRPLVYINYHHEWFNDPKNWNDAEKLFPQNTTVLT